MNKVRFDKRALPLIVVSLGQYDKLQALANKEDKPLGDYLKAQTMELLNEKEVTLKVPRKVWDIYLKFFEGIEDDVTGSMIGQIASTGEYFERAIRAVGDE